jgi:hypothetical protein
LRFVLDRADRRIIELPGTMSKEPFALSTISPAYLGEDGDYDAICAAVMESARGRWFLEEYAHGNRKPWRSNRSCLFPPIDSSRELTAVHIRAALCAVPVSGMPRADAPPSPATAPAPVEPIAPPPAPAPIQPITATPAAPARSAARPVPRAAQNDPLAALKAMTDEKRIALFT